MLLRSLNKQKSKKKIKQLKIQSVIPLFRPLHTMLSYKNWFYFNQQILDDQRCDSGLNECVSYFKKLSKVESHPNYIKVWFQDRIQTHTPINYLIDRFQSKGNEKLERLAKMLKKLQKSQPYYDMYRSYPFSSLQEQLKKVNTPYYIVYYFPFTPTGMNIQNIIISKGLLTLLQFNPNSIALALTKLEDFAYQFADNNSYYEIMHMYLSNLTSYFEAVINGKTSHQQFQNIKNRQTIVFYTKILNKNKDYLYCRATSKFVTPNIGLILIDKVEAVIPSVQSNNFTFHFKQQSLALKHQSQDLIMDEIKDFSPIKKTKLKNASYKQIQTMNQIPLKIQFSEQYLPALMWPQQFQQQKIQQQNMIPQQKQPKLQHYQQ